MAERVKRIVIECQESVGRLIRTVAGDCTIVTRGQPLPPFDVHCPLLTLPRVFGTTLENIPADVPYLLADGDSADAWYQRLAGDAHVLKIGLAWAGSKGHKNDGNRSMPLEALAPLAQIQGVKFYSLQKGDGAAQAAHPPAGMKLVDWSGELNDFSDTAGLITNLDMIISVDTAVVHLAGAMGKTVWTMLPFAPDWRWMLGREDSPWYPTMRLFRQPQIGDWDSVIRDVVEALTDNRPTG